MRNLLFPFGIKPKAHDLNTSRYGGMYTRSMAAVIDIMIVFFLLQWLFVWMHGELMQRIDMEAIAQLTSQMSLNETLQVLHAAGFFAFIVAYSLLQFLVVGVMMVTCQVIYHTTPGKWLTGLRVVRRHDHTQSPLRIVYVWRYLAYLVSCVPLMIGFFWGSFNKEHRTWHDMLADTVVIDTRPPGWYWQQIKRGVRWLLRQGSAKPVEQAVAEPTTEQSHDDGKKPV